MPLDPSLNVARTGAKAGFDLTLPLLAVPQSALAIPVFLQPRLQRTRRLLRLACLRLGAQVTTGRQS